MRVILVFKLKQKNIEIFQVGKKVIQERSKVWWEDKSGTVIAFISPLIFLIADHGV